MYTTMQIHNTYMYKHFSIFLYNDVIVLGILPRHPGYLGLFTLTRSIGKPYLPRVKVNRVCLGVDYLDSRIYSNMN